MDDTEFEDRFLRMFERKPDEPRPSWAFQSENIAAEMEKIPLFMTRLPENPEENADLCALQALLYEGSLEEIALNFRNQGNEAYSRGKSGLQDALIYYTRGIEQQCQDGLLAATLYLGRSAVNLALKSYRKAILDAESAVSADPSVRQEATLRSAKAYFALGKYEKVIALLEDIGHPDAATLLEQSHDEVARGALQDKCVDQERLQSPINQVLLERNITMVKECPEERAVLSQLAADYAGFPSVHLNADAVPCWPVILLYPFYAEMDMIQSFNEQAHFSEHLRTVFSVPAPWDVQGLYRNIGLLEIYYNPYGTRDLFRIPRRASLRLVVDRFVSRIESGALVFYVIPRIEHKTAFFAKFNKPEDFFCPYSVVHDSCCQLIQPRDKSPALTCHVL